MDKITILETEKIPSTSDNHLGIEIEFVSPFESFQLEEDLINLDLHANCTLKEDGSIDENNRPPMPHNCSDWESMGSCPACDWIEEQPDMCGHELTVMCTQKDLRFIMNKVNVFLKKAEAKVNKSCGLHVHIDMRNRKFKDVVKNFMSKQKEMRSIVSKDRLTSEYCKPLTKDEARKGTTNGSRYRDINITAFKELKTIEIRLHEGCIDTKEIINWCNYLVSIADKKRASKIYVNRRLKKCS